MFHSTSFGLGSTLGGWVIEMKRQPPASLGRMSNMIPTPPLRELRAQATVSTIAPKARSAQRNRGRCPLRLTLK